MYFNQLLAFVIRPTLTHLGLEGGSAERLLLGTIAHESGGRHLDQRLSQNDDILGPAIGLYQIEPATHTDLYVNFLSYSKNAKWIGKLRNTAAAHPTRDEQLATNLFYATAVARLIYYRRPEALPLETDEEGLWWYYKRFWNTMQGKAEMDKWIDSYRREVLPLYE